MAKPSEIFWTYPAESESGNTIIVTGRDDVDKFRTSGKYPFRVTLSWHYDADANGMPDDTDARLMEEATDLILKTTATDTAAILTGIYTGDGCRDWVIYTRSLHIFRNIINRALEPLPQLPLKIAAAEAPLWTAYLEMREASYISPDDD